MLEKQDLEAITGAMRTVFREELHSSDTKEFIRDIVVEAVGEALEQIVLPRLDTLESDVSELKSDVSELKSDVSVMKTDISGLKTNMVTVDHLENRVFGMKGELANSGIRAIQQVKTLATELHRNNVISVDQVMLVTAA